MLRPRIAALILSLLPVSFSVDAQVAKSQAEKQGPIQAAPRQPVAQSPTHSAGQSKLAKAATRPLPIPPIPPSPPPAPAVAPPPPSKPERDPNKGSVTGLSIPRYASLRADVVNLRAGPGDRYPIDWVYKRAGLPVEILREFDNWRLVQMPDGAKGWMHEATLVGRRDFLVEAQRQTLRAEPNESSRAVAVIEPGVIGRIRTCEAGAEWCRVQVGGYTGFLSRKVLWGLLPNEAIKP